MLDYTKELLLALEDAADPNTIALLLFLLDGAPTDQQIDLLSQFGLSEETIEILKTFIPL